MKNKEELIVSISRFFLLCFVIVNITNCSSVCEVEALRLEILQDLADNNMLDCLRVIPVPSKKETEKEKNLRLAAQWDTSCSFEAETNWINELKTYYNINTLVDSQGLPVNRDFDDQADMCEIIRAALSKGLFKIPNLNMSNLPKSLASSISCTGKLSFNLNSQNQVTISKPISQICAANSLSFFNKSSWAIFLQPAIIKFNNTPNIIPKNSFQALNSNIKYNSIVDLMNKGNGYNLNRPNVANLYDLYRNINPNTEIQKLLNSSNLQNSILNDQINTNQLFKAELLFETSKKINLIDITINTQYIQIPSSIMPISINNSSLNVIIPNRKVVMLSYYSLSFDLVNYGNYSVKMRFNNLDLNESTNYYSNTKNIYAFSLISTLVSETEFLNNKSSSLSIVELSNSKGVGKANGEIGNYSIGAAIFTTDSYFSLNPVNVITMLSPVDSYTAIPNYTLPIIEANNISSFYLVILNMNFELPYADLFSVIITANGKELYDTTVIRGKSNNIAINSATVIRISQGQTDLGIKYLYTEQEIINLNTISTFSDLNSSNCLFKSNQSFTAFKLPQTSTYSFFKANTPIYLKTGMNRNLKIWKPFKLGAFVELTSSSSVLIMYHVLLKVNNSPISLRIKVNGNKYFKTSYSNIQGEEYASAEAIILKKLVPGRYELDIEFYSEADVEFNPVMELIDKQHVVLKIINFNQ